MEIYAPKLTIVPVQLESPREQIAKISINRPKLAKMSRNWINLRYA